MSGSVNRVTLVGHLGQDPEVRTTASGQMVATLRLATSESFTDKAGERQERTEWHTVVLWAKQAELAQRYLAKGRQAYIEGRLSTRKWQDKDGRDRYTTEIVASQVVFLGGGKAEGRTAPAAAADDGFDDSNVPF